MITAGDNEAVFEVENVRSHRMILALLPLKRHSFLKRRYRIAVTRNGIGYRRKHELLRIDKSRLFFF